MIPALLALLFSLSACAAKTPSTPAIGADPAASEERFLRLEYPAKIRMGDSEHVYLTLVAEGDESIVLPSPKIYESHRVIVETRLDFPGMQVTPSGLVSQPLEPGRSATFSWSVRPSEAENYQGTLWVYLRFVDKTSGEESRKTVSALGLDIEAVTFSGLSGGGARLLGFAGCLLGIIVAFPLFKKIAKDFVSRRKKI